MGCSLGRFLRENGETVSGYYSRSSAGAGYAAQLTGTAAFGTLREIASASDMIFLTVPDGEITKAYRQLLEEADPEDLNGVYLYHCSGALPAREAFPDAESYGMRTASVHPLFPVSNKETVWQELKNAYFCLEGDAEAVSAAEVMLQCCGARTQQIDPADKTKYHAGCVMASNLVIALLQQSFDLLCDCGFTPESAAAAIRPLAQSNLDHVFADGCVQALTGPVERNDCVTVEKHLQTLSGQTENIYRTLSRTLTDIAREKHPETDYTQLRRLLEDEKEGRKPG